MQGTVQWFNDAKGFGMITADGGPTDIYVHFSALADGPSETLEEGDRVEFDIERGPKGLQARDCRVIEVDETPAIPPRRLSSYCRMDASTDDRGHRVKVTVEITRPEGPDPDVLREWQSAVQRLVS